MQMLKAILELFLGAVPEFSMLVVALVFLVLAVTSPIWISWLAADYEEEYLQWEKEHEERE